MKRQKMLALLLAFLLSVQTVGCGGKNADDTAKTTAAETMDGASGRETEKASVTETEGIAGGGQDTVVFEDTVLEQILRLKTGIFDRELTQTDLQTITDLTISVSRLREILPYLNNLTELELTGNGGYGGSDEGILSELSALPGLTKLNLNRIQVEAGNLSALSELTNLQELSLTGVQASDLSALSGLTGLTSLSLRFGGMTRDTLDLSPLSGLTGLSSLTLSGDGYYIKDLGALSGLTGLKSLCIAYGAGYTQEFGVDTTDFSALSGLTNLETLELGLNFSEETWETIRTSQTHDTGVCDLSAIAGLTGLKSLKLTLNSRTYIDLNALSGLTGLTSLEIAGKIPDVFDGSGNIERLGGDMSGLTALTNLTDLTLTGSWDVNQIASIPALPSLTALTVMHESDLSSARLGALEQAGVCYVARDCETNPQPFPNLTNLKTLELRYLGFYNSDKYYGTEVFRLPGLTELKVERDTVSSLLDAPEGTWNNLTSLTLSGVGADRDLSVLSALPNLTSLTLSDFGGDLSILSGLSNLTSFTLTGSGGDMSALLSILSGLPNLTSLTLTGLGGDLSALSGLSNLTSLTLTGSIYGALPALPNLTSFTVNGNYIQDLSILYDFPNLTILWE